MRLPLRWKIALPQIGIFLVIFLGLSLYLSGFLRQMYLSTLQTRLQLECQLLSADAEPLLRNPTGTAAASHFARSVSAALQARITLIDADGTVLADSEADPATMENHLTRPEVIQALAQGSGSSTRLSATTGIENLYTAIPIKTGGALLGLVRIAVPLSEIDATIHRLQTALLTAMILAAILTLGASLWTARRAATPLEELTEAAQQVAAGNLEATLLPASTDEIGQLTEAFNAMTAQLRSQFSALRAERGKLDAVLMQMTDGVVIVDAHDSVTLINPSAEHVFALEAGRALGHSAAEVLRHHLLLDLLAASRAQDQLVSTSVDVGLPPVFLLAIALPLRDQLAGFTLFLFQDLTRMRKLETVRRDFVGNLSHELRTPLAALQALAETLQESALEDPVAARRFIELMLSEVATLNQLSAELLELSQIESGKVPLVAVSVSPAVLLQETLERMQLLAERNQITLRSEPAENLPDVVADPSRIGQVFANLIHNAVKFTPPGGTIRLSAQQMDNEVRFSVADTGSGIAADDLPRIFERFYKADPSRSGGGTGLGLAIARHLIEAHGGTIWAESALGKGSEFFFTLPVRSRH
jgi:two-component system phosphate regulon sensor histidine kinase PhoR